MSTSLDEILIRLIVSINIIPFPVKTEGSLPLTRTEVSRSLQTRENALQMKKRANHEHQSSIMLKTVVNKEKSREL